MTKAVKLLSVMLAGCLATLTLTAADAPGVTGKWIIALKGGWQIWGKTQAGAPMETVTLILKADGNTLTGTMSNARGPGVTRISHGQVDGNNLSFDLMHALYGTMVTTHYTGTLDGDTIHLIVKSQGGGQGQPEDAHRSTD